MSPSIYIRSIIGMAFCFLSKFASLGEILIELKFRKLRWVHLHTMDCFTNTIQFTR